MFRKSFEANDYVDKVTDSVSALSCIAVWDQPHKYGPEFEALFGKTYEVETGVRLFDDAGDATKSKKIVEESFEFTLDKPEYKFGDAYDFSDKPSTLDAWSKGSDFDLSEIIEGATGKGFLKVAGGFRVAPNFNSFSYQLQFAADLPASAMPDGEMFQFFITKTDDGDAAGTTKETFGCMVEVGNPLNAEVRQFTGDFDAAETGVAVGDFNAANREDTTWRRNYDLDNYSTKDSILDGFKTLTCTAMINLDQEDVIAMAEKKFDIKLGLKIFADKTSTAPKAVAEKTAKYAMPKKQEATMEPLDPITRDVQILIEDTQTVQADAAGFTATGPI